ncbi:MAG: PIN domain-containing protein [Spirochaetota bacterium]
MYLIDTSIWIDYFRGKLNDILRERVFNYIENDLIAYSGVILSELLIGCKSEKEKVIIKDNFTGFQYIALSHNDFVDLAEIGNILLRKGITVPLTDIIIYYQAKFNKTRLLTYDKNFKYFNDKNIEIIRAVQQASGADK